MHYWILEIAIPKSEETLGYMWKVWQQYLVNRLLRLLSLLDMTYQLLIWESKPVGDNDVLYIKSYSMIWSIKQITPANLSPQTTEPGL